MVSLVVVIPIRSNSEIDRTIDTIKSIEHYTTEDRLIVLLEDNGTKAGDYINQLFPNLIVIKSESPGTGPFGRLYTSLSKAFIYILQHHEFDVLLRLDTDSLVIGRYPEKDAISYFKENSHIGLLGSYRKNCNGDIRDFSPVRKILRYETGFITSLTKPDLRKTLNSLLEDATKNGYELGEHCLGAACFISYSCLKALHQKGYLSLRLEKSKLADDHILGLVVKACGYDIGDFAIDGYPLCLNWHGLPYAPDKLIERGKKIIHSTKSYKNFDESRTREYFRNHRKK